jgi:hypothetical protein
MAEDDGGRAPGSLTQRVGWLLRMLGMAIAVCGIIVAAIAVGASLA